MSAQTDADISDAIAALGKSLASIKERLAGQDERIAEIRSGRREYLDGEVHRLLPDINSRSLQRLQDEMPGFVDASVQAAFAENRKFLGLFAGSGYRQALLGLQTRLAHRLESGGDAMLASSGKELTFLQADREEIARLQGFTQGIYAQLQEVQGTGVALSGAVMEEIARIAQKAREMEALNEQQKKKKTENQTANEVQAGRWRDDDSWLVFASDISADLPNLIPRCPRAGGGSFDGAGASADFSGDSAPSRSRNDSGMSAVAASLAVGIGSSSAAEASSQTQDAVDDIGVGIPDIATDDSLGTFS